MFSFSSQPCPHAPDQSFPPHPQPPLKKKKKEDIWKIYGNILRLHIKAQFRIQKLLTPLYTMNSERNLFASAFSCRCLVMLLMLI